MESSGVSTGKRQLSRRQFLGLLAGLRGWPALRLPASSSTFSRFTCWGDDTSSLAAVIQQFDHLRWNGAAEKSSAYPGCYL